MEFNFDNERPIYMQLVEQLKKNIISGYYQSGTRLPSVRELALIARVNPNTMQKALTEIENDKLIYTERTNGKYVTNDKKLIENIRNNMAEEITKKYLSNMANIGIDSNQSIEYLHQLGGKKWPY